MAAAGGQDGTGARAAQRRDGSHGRPQDGSGPREEVRPKERAGSASSVVSRTGRVPVITLDGPSGSGKSTVGRAVAASLGWRYVDTGATYRAATLAVLRSGTDPADAEAVTTVVREVVLAGGLRLGTDPAATSVHLGDEDVSAQIRTAAVTAAVSAVSAVPAVRELLVALQREAIGTDGAVAEGRDVGSVVVPDALLKVYLDADPLVRAARRAGDTDAGVVTTTTTGAAEADLVSAVAADLQRRDALDSGRTTSPLRQADDAVHLDASALSAQEVTDLVLRLVNDPGPQP